MSMVLSPFTPDEMEAQRRAGAGSRGAGIRDRLPDQHRRFFAGLPYLFAAFVDPEGWPVATMLTGEPGFIMSQDETTLRIAAHPSPGDPAAAGAQAGWEIGLLGIDLATRRRNRANGLIAAADKASLTVEVRQSFGNCPQYIQARDVLAAVEVGPNRGTELLPALDAGARVLIERSDTFFVASRSRQGGAAGGLDMSHRGGLPGFVRVQGDRLSIPDFPGNRYFNTLGNLLGDPRASLLFVDFESGDTLQLQGRAEIEWAPDQAQSLDGAERVWHLDVVRGWRRRRTSRWLWSFRDFAPTTEATGTWRR